MPPRRTSSARSISPSACWPPPPTTSCATSSNSSPTTRRSAARCRSAVADEQLRPSPRSSPERPTGSTALPAERGSRGGARPGQPPRRPGAARHARDRRRAARVRQGDVGTAARRARRLARATTPAGRLLLKLPDRELSLPAYVEPALRSAARAALPGQRARPARRRRARAGAPAAARRGGDGRLMTAPTTAPVPAPLPPAEFRCADAAFERDEPMFGTASHVQRWLLVEQSGPVLRRVGAGRAHRPRRRSATSRGWPATCGRGWC